MTVVDLSYPGRAVGGKRPPSAKPVLRLVDYLIPAGLPEHPLAVDDTVGVTFGLQGNDRYGDCVAAGFDNLRRVVTRLLTGVEKDASWAEIVAWYRTQNPGFDENDPGGPGDQGMVMQDFLAWLTKQGLILGFAKLDHRDDEELRAATYLFLAVYFGAVLQEAQIGQTDSHLWDYVPGSPDVGGHCFIGARYTADGRITAVTWAELVDTTPKFRLHCLDEAYVVLRPEHVQHSGFRAGFDLPKFVAGWEAITGRRFPVSVNPPPAPVVGGLDAAGQKLAAWLRTSQGRSWLTRPHCGANRAAADAVKAWAKTEGVL